MVAAIQPAQAAAPVAPAKPRNVIFVLVDDLRYDAMGFLTKGLQTPNIDHLAKNGAYFPNAMVTSALSSPSRATILTGLSARNHRIIDNNNSSEDGLTFFPQYLQQAGYQTAFFGKWHMGVDNPQPRPGFNHWVGFNGQGTYFPTDELTPQELAAGKRNTLNVNGKTVPQQGYITDELTDYAMDWLERGRDRSKPFFLYLSHKAVHSAPTPPERYRHQYADLKIPLPASMADTEDNYRGKPMWVRNQRNSWHGVDFMFHSGRKLTEYIREYYRTLTPVDDSVGRVLDYLRRNKLEDSTTVIFYSDNGFILGEHGLIDKRNAYEPSVRVPLVVYAPGLVPAGKVVEQRVLNLDIAPTIMDMARVPAPPQFEGRSFLALATGAAPASAWKERDFVYEYYWEWNFPQSPTTFAIVSDGYKYIQYHGIWDLDELYDLRGDPNEMRNLASEPEQAARKKELRAALFVHLANNKGDHVIPYSHRTGTGNVLRNKDGAKGALFPAQWDRKALWPIPYPPPDRP
ncbi:MAG TPA: sulfatase [Burkholderiaceae bacterium]